MSNLSVMATGHGSFISDGSRGSKLAERASQ